MKEKHTIVVEYPEGVSPKYSVDTEFPHGGRILSVDFDSDRLELTGLLETAVQDVFERVGAFRKNAYHFTENFTDDVDNFDALKRLEDVLEKFNRA